MKNTLMIVMAALLMGAAPAPPPAHPGDVEMTTYVVGFLHRGPQWTPERTPAIEALQEAHLANIRRLAESGKLALAGPFTDDGELRGMFIFQVASVDEARALCDTDPAVKAGRLSVELHPWYGPKGIRYGTRADEPATNAPATK